MTPGNSLLTFLLASLAVIGLTWAASRMVGRWQVTQTRGRRMRVLEGVPVGKDRSLLLVAVGKEVLVVGTSPQGVQLVHQVADEQAAAELLTAEEPAAQPLPILPSLPSLASLRSLPSLSSLGPKVTALLKWRPAVGAPAPGDPLASTEAVIRSHLARMKGLAARRGGTSGE